MNIFKSLRNGIQGGAGSGDSRESSASDSSSALTVRYDGLDEREAVAELARLNQVDLTAIETFERSHRKRPAVINKLRYLRQTEPLPGYDALESSEVAEALTGADSRTLKAVREYERKLQRRSTALEEIARALHRLNEQPATTPDESHAPAEVVREPAVLA
jgi:hypothetical protein